MTGILETCDCGRKFLRGIYPQKKCFVCEAISLGEPVIVRYVGEEPKMEICEIEEIK